MKRKRLKIVNAKRFVTFLLVSSVILISLGFKLVSVTTDLIKRDDIIISPQLDIVDADYSQQESNEKNIKSKITVVEVESFLQNEDAKLSQKNTFLKNKDSIQEDKAIYTLAKGMYTEADVEGVIGKTAVGVVIMNRVNSNRFPNTVYGVISQRGQFQSFFDGSWERKEPSLKDLKLAKEIYSSYKEYEIKMGLENALYFMNREYSNEKYINWFDENLKFLIKIGNHEFFKE